MDRWLISTAREGVRVLFGIPARLGDASAADAPHLEEQVGDGWLVELLLCLLPAERVWAWWTSSDALKQSKLTWSDAPQQVAPRAVEGVLRRNLALRNMTLAIIPPDEQDQEQALDWVGLDTEHFPDHVWTATHPDRPWDLDAIIAWCRNPKDWKSAASAAAQDAERIVTVLDDYVFCMVPKEAEEQVRHALRELAATWDVSIADGAPEDAWPGR